MNSSVRDRNSFHTTEIRSQARAAVCEAEGVASAGPTVVSRGEILTFPDTLTTCTQGLSLWSLNIVFLVKTVGGGPPNDRGRVSQKSPEK